MMEYVCDKCRFNVRELADGRYVVCAKRDTRRKVEASDKYGPNQMCLDFKEDAGR